MSNDALPDLRAVRHSRHVRLLDHGSVRAREQIDVVIVDRAARKHHAMRVKGGGRDGRVAALVQVVAIRLEAAQEGPVHVVYLDAVTLRATAMCVNSLITQREDLRGQDIRGKHGSVLVNRQTSQRVLCDADGAQRLVHA